MGADIKRRTYADSNVASQTEVDELREEVQDLRQQVRTLQNVVTDMQDAMRSAQLPIGDCDGEPSSPATSKMQQTRKRRRTTPDVKHAAALLQQQCSVSNQASGSADPVSGDLEPVPLSESDSAGAPPVLDSSLDWGRF